MSNCTYIFSRGSKKGSMCNQTYCTKHKQKVRCTWILKRGARKGLECGKNSCSKHNVVENDQVVENDGVFEVDGVFDLSKLRVALEQVVSVDVDMMDVDEPTSEESLTSEESFTSVYNKSIPLNIFSSEDDYDIIQKRRSNEDFTLFRPFQQRIFKTNIKQKEFKNSKIIMI